jgi:hypothetical protein
VADAQLDLKLLLDLHRQFPRRQRFVTLLPLTHPFPQRGMGFLGMTMATVYQSFPTPPTCFVPGLKFGNGFCSDIQTQLGAYLLKGFARFNTEQQMFHVLGLLNHG